MSAERKIFYALIAMALGGIVAVHLVRALNLVVLVLRVEAPAPSPRQRGLLTLACGPVPSSCGAAILPRVTTMARGFRGGESNTASDMNAHAAGPQTIFSARA